MVSYSVMIREYNIYRCKHLSISISRNCLFVILAWIAISTPIGFHRSIRRAQLVACPSTTLKGRPIQVAGYAVCSDRRPHTSKTLGRYKMRRAITTVRVCIEKTLETIWWPYKGFHYKLRSGRNEHICSICYEMQWNFTSVDVFIFIWFPPNFSRQSISIHYIMLKKRRYWLDMQEIPIRTIEAHVIVSNTSSRLMPLSYKSVRWWSQWITAMANESHVQSDIHLTDLENNHNVPTSARNG